MCRFERVHVLPLTMFGQLITMDVHDHMTGRALAAAAGDGATPPVDTPAAPVATGAGGGGPPYAAELEETREGLAMHRGVYARLGVHAAKKRTGWFGRGKPQKGYMELQARFWPLCFVVFCFTRLCLGVPAATGVRQAPPPPLSGTATSPPPLSGTDCLSLAQNACQWH